VAEDVGVPPSPRFQVVGEVRRRGGPPWLLRQADIPRRRRDTKILFVDRVEDADAAKKCRHTAAPPPPPTKDPTTVECVDRYPSHVDDKPGTFALSSIKYTNMSEFNSKSSISLRSSNK
jgi:hypothetical protein